MAEYAGRQWTRAELSQRVGRMDQIAGIQALEYTDGRARGSRMFQVYTGSGLQFEVNVERALDITNCFYRGMALNWTGSTGQVHPAYYEPEGLGWLRSFHGGLVLTCGLDSFGAPTVDEGEAFGIHGRVSNLPAEQVAHRTYWQDDAYILEISGKVQQTRVYGENLLLERRIQTQLGAAWLQIDDTVTNLGHAPQPHMLLYHCNLGFPLIDADTQLHLDTTETVARDADAQPGIDHWREFQPPTPGYREQVFRHAPQPESDGLATARVHNPRLGLDLRLRFSQQTLPHVIQWKQPGQGVYVLGVEPGNSSAVEGRAVARERADLPMLGPGESRAYLLRFEIG
ncbi:MAG: aldose 1-epimerase family protein [Chloroflexi bacterium]|nr:aldose 1-epimerase family protein [Chloroflexota bacterium]